MADQFSFNHLRHWRHQAGNGVTVRFVHGETDLDCLRFTKSISTSSTVTAAEWKPGVADVFSIGGLRQSDGGLVDTRRGRSGRPLPVCCCSIIGKTLGID